VKGWEIEYRALMGLRAKLGDEWDALTPAGAKRVHRWRTGIRRSNKRRFNKRQRTRTAFEKVAEGLIEVRDCAG
jgi:hypothetical protein